MAKNPKRPRDPNELAKSIVSIAIGEEENIKPSPVNAGRRKGGLKGGRARSKSMTSEQRKEIAKNAAKIRWNKD